MNTVPDFLDTLSKSIGKEVIHEILLIFDEQMKEGIPNLQTYLSERNWPRAREFAHKLKSSALNVGAFEIGKIFLEIEKGAEISLTNENIQRLNDSYLEFQDLTQKWLQSNL